MKYYLWIIHTRREGGPRRFFSLLFSWILLRYRKLFRIGFYEDCANACTSIDVVIPTISKDYGLLSEVVASVRKNLCHSVDNVYIISKNEKSLIDFCAEHDCKFIDEISILGYNKDAIQYVVNGVDRSGWIFQQLLKLSAGKYTHAENYLVLDSDTIFINKHAFIQDGRFIFLQSEEWHQSYFDAFESIFDYKAPTRLSYTSHMMIFNKGKLAEMKKELEENHHTSWDKVYLSIINEREASCISDYDTYANWMLYNYPELIINRPLYNKPLPRTAFASLAVLEERYAARLKSVSFHSYVS